jgi:TonB family protein
MKSKINALLPLLFTIALIVAISACSEKDENTAIQGPGETGTLAGSADSEIGFVEYDVPPKPIGGFEAIAEHLEYPEMSRKKGIEGRVIVSARISETGDVLEAKVARSLDPEGCDRAAIRAIKAVKWEAALKQDKPVSVWITVPVQFTLK